MSTAKWTKLFPSFLRTWFLVLFGNKNDDSAGRNEFDGGVGNLRTVMQEVD